MGYILANHQTKFQTKSLKMQKLIGGENTQLSHPDNNQVGRLAHQVCVRLLTNKLYQIPKFKVRLIVR